MARANGISSFASACSNAIAHQRAGDAAGEAQDTGLDEELDEDVAPPGAEGQGAVGHQDLVGAIDAHAAPARAAAILAGLGFDAAAQARPGL